MPDVDFIKEATAEGKKALESKDISAMHAATEHITKASHKIAEIMYKQAGATAGPEAEAANQNAKAKKKADDVIDAEFEDAGDSK